MAWRPGKTTVVSFCAFWCNTWKQQLPRVDRAKKSLKGLPIEFLNVSVDGRWMDKVKGAPGLVLVDEGGKWSKSLHIDRVPYTIVVDERGMVRWTKFGIIRSHELEIKARGALSRAGRGKIYLTFDDFPWKQLNQELLDVLRSEKVPATFFCIGRNMEPQAAVVKRAAREGHSLQMHSWAHDANHPELTRCQTLILKMTGQKATLYRPPGSEAILGSDGKRLPYATDAAYDYLKISSDDLVRRVAMSVQPGCVIQLHGGLPTTLKALPGIIGNLRKRGYTFSVLGIAKP
jgi:peptidoglycan/xylan/chitin deacetylase (PgdA/CDA1 family)